MDDAHRPFSLSAPLALLGRSRWGLVRHPRHLHPAAITFHVLSGTGVWQEEGKAPVTLRAGDSLFVPAGTIHAHWNPSATENLRFLEFIVAEKDKGRSIPQPAKN